MMEKITYIKLPRLANMILSAISLSLPPHPDKTAIFRYTAIPTMIIGFAALETGMNSKNARQETCIKLKVYDTAAIHTSRVL